MKYSALFFDFDYTLGDATDCILQGFHYAFREMGLPDPEDEAIRATIGMTLPNAYTLLSGDGEESRRARFTELYIQKANPLQVKGTLLFPGARELLAWLKEEGKTVAIISTKRRSVLEDVFAYQKLTHCVSFMVGGTDVLRSKPAPDAALLALEKAGVAPEEALFIGDTVIDAETAQRAGIDFAAVCNGTTPPEAFDVWPHVFVARDLPALRAWLAK